MDIIKYFHTIVYIAILLLVSVTAGAADISWETESYRAATLANIEDYVGDPGGPFGPPYPREDEKYGHPLPLYSQAVALVPGQSCAHAMSDVESSMMMEVYAKACAYGAGTSNSYAEASFTGTFVAGSKLFLFDYSFDHNYYDISSLEQWITMTDLTDGTVFSNVFFDGLDGTIELPVLEGHTIEVEFGLSASAFSDGLEDINETTMNYSMSIVYKPIRIYNGPYYNLLQTAYDEALNNETIQILAVSLTGDWNINQLISVTLESGYNDILTVADGITTLLGNMTISDGDLTIADGSFEIM